MHAEDAWRPGTPPGPGARAAAAFFRRQEAWRGILEVARRTCERLGRVGGTAAIAAGNEAAWSALSSLLGRDPRIPRKRRLVPAVQRGEARREPVRVALTELDQALRRSRFRCGLLEALEAYFGEPLESQPQRRAQERDSWQGFLQEAEGWFVAESARRWWVGVGRGEAPGARLVRRVWKRGGEARDELRRAVQHVARALSGLPALRTQPVGLSRPSQPLGPVGSIAKATPPAEPLAVFAHRVCGDPHALDPDTLAGRLLLHALTAVLPEGAHLGRGLTAPVLRRNLLLEAAGLATDDTSSTVTAFHLRAALPHLRSAPPQVRPAGGNGASRAASQDARWIEDPVATAACATDTVVVWPLREIRRRPRFFAAGGTVYVVENPQVFQALVDGLIDLRGAELPVEERRSLRWPSLLCTSGQLSLAAVLLLDRLVGRTGIPEPAPHGRDGVAGAVGQGQGNEGSDGGGRKETPMDAHDEQERREWPGGFSDTVLLYYGGDFDVPGLEIAYSVMTRYGEAARPWHMTPADYRHALTAAAGDPGDRRFDSEDRERLERLRHRGFLPDLIADMLEVGRPAYQEGLVHLLLADLLATVKSRSPIPSAGSRTS